MLQRDAAKRTAVASKCPLDWALYCKLQNITLTSKRHKKKLYYQQNFKEAGNNSKIIWKTFNSLIGRDNKSLPTHIKTDDGFISKPLDIANCFNSFYDNKIQKLKSDMVHRDCTSTISLRQSKIMKDKHCTFDLTIVSIQKVVSLLNALQKDMSAGVDNIDGRLLKLSANLYHVLSALFSTAVCFTVEIVCKQMQKHFVENSLLTKFQHAYKSNYLTATPLVHLVDNWYQELDKGNLISVIFLDFVQHLI